METVLAVVAAFMINLGSSTFVINDYQPHGYGWEVDVQTVDNKHRYIVLVEDGNVTTFAQVPVEETICSEDGRSITNDT